MGVLKKTEESEKPSAFNLNIQISHKHLAVSNEEQAFYVLVNVTPTESLPVLRLPLNLCLVLDRSTSMQGMRMQQVKEGTRQIIEQITPEDSLGVVVFSDRANVLLPSRRKIDKSRTKAAINSIQSGGGTELLQGLVAGLKEIEPNRTQQSVNHLIFLTDGQTYGDELSCLEKSKWAGQNQISLTTMGVGADWNENLLDQMATVSGGSSVYIDTPTKIVDVFKSAMQTLSTVVARELTVNIDPVPGVRLKEAFQMTPYICRLGTTTSRILLGPLTAGLGKTLLMEFRIRAEANAGEKNLMELKIEGDIPSRANYRNWESVYISGEFAAKSSGGNEIPSVIVTALGKLAIFQMQEKAMSDLENGKITEATQRLETMAARLLNIGETELARAALLESGRLARSGHLSAEGRKKIRYGTRSLSILPKEIDHD